MPRKELYREYDENNRLIKKECGKCGKILNLLNFSKNRNSKDGYSSMCKHCKVNYNYFHKCKGKDNMKRWEKWLKTEEKNVR